MKTTTTISAASLLSFRELNEALPARGQRPFSYPKICALVARGLIPSYENAMRTMRGKPVRLYDLDEVIAAIERSVKPAA